MKKLPLLTIGDVEYLKCYRVESLALVFKDTRYPKIIRDTYIDISNYYPIEVNGALLVNEEEYGWINWLSIKLRLFGKAYNLVIIFQFNNQ